MTLLAGMVVSAAAYAPSHYAATSRLNSGRWVKISTDTEGMHQLTYDQLRELGFNNPERVQVYGYGALNFTDHNFASDAPDDLQPTPTMHTADGRILFFGYSDACLSAGSTVGNDSYVINVKRNFYDTRSYYFLSDVDGSAPIATLTSVNPGNRAPLTSHIHVDYVEHDVQNSLRGGVGYHDRKVSAGDALPYTFRIRNYSPSTSYPNGSFYYSMAISTGSSLRFSVASPAEVDSISATHGNSWTLTDADYKQYYDARGVVVFRRKAGTLLADTTVTFSIVVPRVSAIRYVAPDRVALRYPRANTLDATDPALIMNFGNDENQAGRRVVFSGVTSASDIAVWNIDVPSAIAAYPLQYDEAAATASFVLHEAGTRRVVAFNPSAQYPSPEVVGEVAPQNLHGTETPDMLIITTAEQLPQAEQLAAAHRQYQGMKVNVVVHDIIFNEFSSGTRDIMGYRRFIKMYYDRDPQHFKYVLLLGPCHYDNRSISVEKVDRLLTYQNTNESQTSHVITNYTSDNILGMLSDHYIHDNIALEPTVVAVGRVPSLNASQAQAYVNKAIRRLQAAPNPDAYSRALLCSGEGDLNTHALHSLEVADTMLNVCPDLTLHTIACQLYTRQGHENDNMAYHNLLAEGLTAGAGYFNYIGHGDPNFIGTYHQWDRSYAAEYDYNWQPFTMFSSCDQFAFDRQSNGLIETMLFNEHGGILGGVGASRSVYISHNQVSCMPTAKAYVLARPGDTYGDVYLHSREISLTMDSDRATVPALVNTLNYNLAGDPAIPVGAPDYGVVITSINGTTLPTESMVSVDPMTPFHITGFIADGSGSAVMGFNGTARIKILAPEVTETTLDTFNEPGYKSINIKQEFNIFAEVEVDVKNGRFDAELTVAAPSLIGGNRLVVTAVDPDARVSALGTARAMSIADYDPALHGTALATPPSVQSFTAGSDSFVPGGEVTPDIAVKAVIDPSPSGLALGTSPMVTRTSLTLDHTISYNNLGQCLTRRADGLYELNTTLDNLTEGIHTLTLTVANNVGQIDRSTIDFMVVTRAEQPDLAITEPTADTPYAVIDIDGTATADDNRVVVADMHGKTVFSATDVAFPYRWALGDIAGKPVADGLYTVTVMLRDGHQYVHSTPATLVVIR